MVPAYKLGPTVQNTTECTKKAKKTEKENTYGRMVVIIRELGRIIK